MESALAAREEVAVGTLRPIEKRDNAPVAQVLRAVLTEFGCTGPGFAIHDPEVDAMYETYHLPRSAYFIVERDGEIVGGAGIAPLKGTRDNTCELQKFYILPEYRNLGYGKELLSLCLEAAHTFGFARCYIETIEAMKGAARLYLRHGFDPIYLPLGSTGHHGCTRWYVKVL